VGGGNRGEETESRESWPKIKVGEIWQRVRMGAIEGKVRRGDEVKVKGEHREEDTGQGIYREKKRWVRGEIEIRG
jgi:hypothetical protein